MKSYDLLIIDDNDNDVLFLAESLKTKGIHSVNTVISGADAFIFFEGLEKEDLPNIVIINHHLSDIMAIDFIRNLQGNDKYADLCFMVISGSELLNEIEAYNKVGIFDFVVKPISHHEYLAIADKIKRKLFLNNKKHRIYQRDEAN